MADRFFVLTNQHKGCDYLDAMREAIKKQHASNQAMRKRLSAFLLDSMPEYTGLETRTPSLDEWSSNHMKAGWSLVDEGKFKLSNDTTQPRIHSYSDFAESSDMLLLKEARLTKWETLRLSSLERGTWSDRKLSEEGILYTEALFIILGFDASILDTHTFWRQFTMLRFDKPTGEDMFKDWLIKNTKEARALNKNPNFRKELISTHEFIKWATSRELLKEIEPRALSNRPILENILFQGLIDKGLIEKNSIFDALWPWTGKKNQKSYLAKQLKRARLFGDNCHKELESYIKHDGNHIQADKPDPSLANKIPIDEIIKSLKE